MPTLTTIRTSNPARFGVVTLLCVTLTACADSEPRTPSSNGATPSASDSIVDMTGAELLNSFWEQQDRSEEEYIAYFTAREEQTAACMTAAGFDYYPQPVIFSDTKEDPTWNEEYLSENGYGISIEVPDVVIPDNENDFYYDSLSPEGQIQYDEAMYGPPEAMSDTDGCRFAGVEEEQGDAAPPIPSLITAIWDEINRRISSQMEYDQGLDASITAFSQCVVDGGGESVDYTQESVSDQVRHRYNDSPPTTDQELADFQTWEREIAVLEYRCAMAMEETIRAAYDAIESEVIEEVVAEYRNELEALALATQN